MSFVLADAVIAAPALQILPWITTWSRLEVLPTTEDLEVGLQAGVADPLWLLHRQHAFLELRGEDAGTPVDVRLAGQKARVARFHAGPLDDEPALRAVDVEGLDAPLETVVEREDPGRQPRHEAASGARLVRMLRAAGVDPAPLLAAVPLAVEAPDDPLADQPGADWFAVLGDRAVDSVAVADAVRTGMAADGTLAAVPGGLGLADGASTRDVLVAWLAGHEQVLGRPRHRSSWVPNRMEYAYGLAADVGAGEVVLRADQYVDGHLDWYDHVADTGPTLGDPEVAMPPERVTWPAAMPSPVRYPGMPADRLFAFEDDTVNLGGLETGPGDLGRLLLAEFGLVYANDWFLFPVDLEVGSLFRVEQLVVRDTFGVASSIPPSHDRTGGAPWEVFELSTSGQRRAGALQDLFFLPPVVPRRLEGAPLEEVRVIRDEMANLVWAVERMVPGTSGDPYDRALESTRVAARQQLVGDPGSAELVYRLQTPVPAHWIPFAAEAKAPVTSPGFDVVLRRRALLRTMPDGTTEEVHPKGVLLRTDLGQDVGDETPLAIEDEEAAREGIVVRRSWQYTRWIDGSAHWWVGRSKRTGRGEGSSGLRFDASPRLGATD